MQIPVFIGLDNKPTFRMYTLRDGAPGYWHQCKGVKGPARMFHTVDGVMPMLEPNGIDPFNPELVLVFPDRSTKTATECWADSVPV